MKCSNCSAEAYFERGVDEKRKYVFFGYCADCWKDLEPVERAVLKGEDKFIAYYDAVDKALAAI